ncbi:MAG: hypothetical protein U0R64_06110 [Candidatus Nanopelagicales bacterium]
MKATSVILVVLIRPRRWPWATPRPRPFWMQVGGMLEPLRMPVFFVVSGMLAASAVN